MIKYRVVSDSMEPLIPIGSELQLEKVSLLNLKRFDIVVFEDGNKYTCHYIWHINESVDLGAIITRNLKGDYDEPFHVEKVLGKVVNFKIPFLLKVKLLFWTK